jgi:hypothetical protein
MSIVQVKKQGTSVSVTFNLQTSQQAKELTDLIAGQLKEGELHLLIGAKPNLIIGVPQGTHNFTEPAASSSRKIK